MYGDLNHDQHNLNLVYLVNHEMVIHNPGRAAKRTFNVCDLSRPEYSNYTHQDLDVRSASGITPALVGEVHINLNAVKRMGQNSD
jgi:hypothetical protein